jgi:uncharacterized Tic20 family protein
MTDPNSQTPDPNIPPAPPTAPAAPAAPLSQEQDVQWASFAHLGGILGILPSLIIWLVFKDRGRFTDTEAKEALNFQITVAIAWVALFILSSILTAVTFGIFGFVASLLYFALWAAVIVFSILGFLKAKDGQHYRYPFAIRLIK